MQFLWFFRKNNLFYDFLLCLGLPGISQAGYWRNMGMATFGTPLKKWFLKTGCQFSRQIYLLKRRRRKNIMQFKLHERPPFPSKQYLDFQIIQNLQNSSGAIHPQFVGGNTKSITSSWRTKIFRVKIAIFSYFRLFLAMPSNLQKHMQKFDIARNSTGTLAPGSKAIGLETISGDPLSTYYYTKKDN